MDEILNMTARELRQALRQGSIGAEELTRLYLNRIEAHDGQLNAVAELNESAIAQARKLDSQRSRRDELLYGLPLLIKDNIDVAGLHTTAGSLALTDNLARTNAAIVDNILRNGGVILGKTNMTEFANFTSSGMPNGYSSRGGSVYNAYARSLDPSGSSTGSAVAVSAGFCAAAVGTDTSFSIVECATSNGVTGLKPRCGALPSSGILPISRTLDSAGPLSRDLADAILLYSGMADRPLAPIEPKPASELRIAVNVFNQAEISQAQCGRYARLFDALRAEGARFENIEQPYSPCQRSIMLCEFRRDLERYLAGAPARLKTLDDIIAFYRAEPESRMKYGISVLEEAAALGADDQMYTEALAERARMRRRVLDELAQYDACVMTGPTNVMHFTGLPSLALKLCTGEDGCPRGIILYGADERRLLAAALTIEAHCLPVRAPEL